MSLQRIREQRKIWNLASQWNAWHVTVKSEKRRRKNQARKTTTKREARGGQVTCVAWLSVFQLLSTSKVRAKYPISHRVHERKVQQVAQLRTHIGYNWVFALRYTWLSSLSLDNCLSFKDRGNNETGRAKEKKQNERWSQVRGWGCCFPALFVAGGREERERTTKHTGNRVATEAT